MITALSSVLLSLVIPAANVVQSDPLTLDLQAALEKRVAKNDGNGGGILRVASKSDGVLWEGSFGNATQGGAPIPKEATFEIASTSKTFTAVIMLQLAEEGRLRLDDKIARYLPRGESTGLLLIDGHDYTPELTIRQLLNHTSGLPDYWYDPPFVTQENNAFLEAYIADPNHVWTPTEVLSYAALLDPIGKPGEGWHYSDTGYLLAGRIIEKVTGSPLHEVYRARLLTPLGMKDTWLHWRERPTTAKLQSHRYESDWDMYDKPHQSADWAGGGLVSSTVDLERFLRALADGALFSNPESLQQMKQWVKTGEPGVKYGLGLYWVKVAADKGHLFGHDGYGNSWMYYWPKYDLTIVGTLNQSENDWWPLLRAIAKQVD